MIETSYFGPCSQMPRGHCICGSSNNVRGQGRRKERNIEQVDEQINSGQTNERQGSQGREQEGRVRGDVEEDKSLQYFVHKLQGILKRITNMHINTYLIKPTIPHYNVKFSNAWKNAPKINTITHNNTTTTPLPTVYNHIHPLKYPPQQCIYTDGSFIPPSKNSEGQIVGNTAGSGVYSPYKNIQILERLLEYPNILRVELNTILIAIYEPKMVAHICFKFRIYLELHLRSLMKYQKV